MNIKDFFTGKGAANDNAQEQAQKPQDLQGATDIDSEMKHFSENAVAQMTELQKQGLLTHSIEEYIKSEKFLLLLKEFPVKAAVRIFDAEEKAKAALEQGRQGAIDDILKRKAIPKSMKAAQSAVAQDDYSKMSSDEFRKIKEKLAASVKR